MCDAGEVQLLQSEVLRHEAQRESLASELLQLTEQVLQLQQQQEEHLQLKQQHQDIAQKYNALLQMYGEKVEEVDELRLDLADVKEMYKAQINQLMQQ
ncbi:TATA element modulatory factor 1 TATA binding [Trinorchestia longiramus]|nr:TATA element modulatory factor 1 TATA binding [Trinorchestia longiramus]